MSPAPLAAPARRAATELWDGFRTLWRGFGFWKHAPGLMWLGLVPAAIAGAILVGGLAALAMLLDPIVTALTPFADDWDAVWQGLVRITLGLAIIITAAVLSVRVFSALALTIGGPIYERICRRVDAAYGRATPDAETGFWRGLGDMGGIVLRSIGGSLLVGLVSLIPGVGAFIGTALGILLTAFVVTREFTLLPFQLRGLDPATRRAALHGSRWRRLGFGLAVQLCYAVPLGAVVSMPCAVAGGTRLARELLGESVELAGAPQKRPVSD